MVTQNLHEFASDPLRWKLITLNGRQRWQYTSNDTSHDICQSDNQSFMEKYWLSCHETSHNIRDTVSSASDHATAGFNFFSQLQSPEGHWAGEYGGPLFLLPGLIITCYLTNVNLSLVQNKEIIRYLKNTVNQDGGWGLHIEGDSGLLGTVTNYVVLRILGVSPNEQICMDARDFIKKHGGATGIPSWGKFWLAVMNIYEWDGLHPLLPELWLLPYWLPFHPGRTWCHSRQIYLPMSYVYAKRIKVPENDLILQLRSEIYCGDYQEIDWKKARDSVASIDVYAPHHRVLDFVNVGMDIYEKYYFPSLREMALETVVDHVRADDRNSNFISIGPISKVINMLVMYFEDGPDSYTFQSHVDRISDYLWMGPDGMRMQGTNGSQLWDTALAIQGVLESSEMINNKEFRETIIKTLEFLANTQVTIKENTQDYSKYYRHINKGAFPFSTHDCGWIVSDCTAEGLKAVILLQQLSFTTKMVSDELIFDGIHVLLSMQNNDGGFASYEPRRGPLWLEVMNPSEVFGEIMVDYSYTECSSAVVQCLTTFQKYYPNHRTNEIQKCIQDAIDYIKLQQRDDGSWFGSWAVCFTYATWFGIEALSCIGEKYSTSEYVKNACEFLCSKQREDGGWGESFKSCTVKQYIEHPTKSQVVQTSWACLALLAAEYPDRNVISKGIELLKRTQCLNGEWKQESIEGVFNKTCGISYPNYKFIFPIWALNRYSARYD